MNQNFDIFYFSSILVKCVQDDPNKHTMKFQLNWSKRLYKEQTFAPRVFHKVSVRTLTERDKQTQAIRDPERPTLTSHSLQSITRPFQKRFREVFGNARILIFYLSIKAWEEKSLPKSHLGWFFLVFGEGKATKENMPFFLVHLTFKLNTFSASVKW